MKNVKMVVLGLMLIPVFMTAQPRHAPDHELRKEEVLEKMKTLLELSDEQVAQIQAIDAQYESEEEALREEIRAAHERLKDIREEKKGKVEALMTDEQLEKLEVLKEGREKRRREGRRGKRAHRAP